MDLFLLRHGQSANNALPEQQRVEDPGLTDLGQQQAELLADWAQSVRLTHLVTSPFRRALLTTRPIHEKTGLIPQVWIDIHELGGCYAGYHADNFEGRPGMTGDAIRADFPRYVVPDEIDHTGWWKSRKRENPLEVIERASRFMETVNSSFDDPHSRIAFVMHADFISVLVDVLLENDSPEENFAGDIWNAGVTHIQWNSDALQLARFNCAKHIGGEYRST